MPDIALHLTLLHSLSYFGIFIIIVLSGHFIPIPEDISLITTGYITALGYAKLLPVILVSMTAPVVGDIFLFYLSSIGSRFAPHPDRYKNWRLFKFASHHMHHNTVLTVILMRFITGFRFLSPVVSSYLKVPPRKYFTANAISAAIYGPFFVLLGYHFNPHITKLLSLVTSLEHDVLFIMGGFILILLLYSGYKMYNTHNAQK